MLSTTKQIVKAALAADSTLSEQTKVAVLSTLEGKTAAGLIKTAPLDRVLTRQQVAEIIGKSVKSVDVYGRRGVFKRVNFGGSRSSGYSEASVREAMEAQKL